jgi:hypothetical protein
MSASPADRGERSDGAGSVLQRPRRSVWTRPEVHWGAGVLALAGVIRLVFWLVYQPASFGDTPSYLRLAQVVARGSLRAYDGTRTPGYPAFLALVRGDPQPVWLGQMALGLLITLGIYWVCWSLTGRPRLAAGVAAIYSLLPGLLFFEAALLTETLTTFFIIGCLVGLAALERSTTDRSAVVAAGLLGLSASLAALARPLFFVLPVVLLPFVWCSGVGRERWARSAAFALAPIVLLGGWLAFIDSKYGMLSPTVMGGYSLVQHTGAFFEYLPDETAPIRDTYLRYREAQIAARGTQTNAIWDAIPEISRASGLGFYDLSREMQRLSLWLIRQHPDLYARSAAEGWVAFWKAPIYWDLQLVSPAWLQAALPAYASLTRLLLVVTNLAFLALCLAGVFLRRVRRALAAHTTTLAGAAMVLVVSVVQTLLDHGDNPRFLVPLQMVVLVVVVLTAEAYLANRSPGRDPANG